MKIRKTDESRFWTEAQSCNGCMYEEQETWRMPCRYCSRRAKDYYREFTGTMEGETFLDDED